ncbi:MAG: pseudouridine synthase [Synechococcus lacustris]
MKTASWNNGWTYRDRISPAQAGLDLISFYAGRYPHSSAQCWAERLAAGELELNGVPVSASLPLACGDQLSWRRPPWQEPPVPDQWQLLHDDGDLLVINKPSGLPVLPAGGFLNHTVLGLLAQRYGDTAPRPVHRLGRFTSGLLVCARQPESRAWLSARLRESSRTADNSDCQKVYRALTAPLPPELQPGQPLAITTPIGRRPHPLLGSIWAAALPADRQALAAASCLTLLERRADACLVEVEISSGRPHQIRIHTAAIGAPLLGDPLYRADGSCSATALPGDGGYQLHAQRLRLLLANQTLLNLSAPPPPGSALAELNQP